MAIVGLLPRVLSLIPKVTFSFSGGRLPFSKPPAVRILLQFRGHRRFPDAFLAECAIRDSLIRFHIPVATPVRLAADFVLSKTAGWQTTTLAHSSNYRLQTDCVRPLGP